MHSCRLRRTPIRQTLFCRIFLSEQSEVPAVRTFRKGPHSAGMRVPLHQNSVQPSLFRKGMRSKKTETAAVSRILFLFRKRGGDHLSMRPEPGIQTPRATAHPLFGLAPGGACLDGGNCFRSRRALAPPFHPCRIRIRRYAFCCAFLSGAYRPRHPLVQGTPRSVESGLSSGPTGPAAACRRLRRQYTPNSRKIQSSGIVFPVLCVILPRKQRMRKRNMEAENGNGRRNFRTD